VVERTLAWLSKYCRLTVRYGLDGEAGNGTLDSRDGVSGNDSLDGGTGTDTRIADPSEKSIVGFP
jgi:hypothetical protein